MPSRILREGILTSDRVNNLTPAGEVFYRRLMSVVDDYGRFDGRPGLIRVSCFPLRVDAVREADISRWITECVMAGLIVLYAVDGKNYMQMHDFNQQQRSKSKYPPPSDGQLIDVCEADAKQTSSSGLADVHLVGVGVVDVLRDAASPSALPAPMPAARKSNDEQVKPDPKGSRLPVDWVLPEDWARWCQETRPDLNPKSVAAEFRDFWVGKAGKDGRKADWLATWRNWCRAQKSGTRKMAGVSGSGDWTGAAT